MAMAIQDKMAARARARWLAAKAGSDARETSALLLFDTIAAVGFAAGIAGAIAAGSMQAWPYMVLAAGSGAARGLFARAAARKGAADAARAKIRLRCDVVAAALRRPAAATLTTGALMSAAIDEVEALDGFVARFAPARKAAAIAPVLVLVAIAFGILVVFVVIAVRVVMFAVAVMVVRMFIRAAADQKQGCDEGCVKCFHSSETVVPTRAHGKQIKRTISLCFSKRYGTRGTLLVSCGR